MRNSGNFFQFSSNQGEEIQSNVNKFPVRQFQIKVKTQGETFFFFKNISMKKPVMCACMYVCITLMKF